MATEGMEWWGEIANLNPSPGKKKKIWFCSRWRISKLSTFGALLRIYIFTSTSSNDKERVVKKNEKPS